MTQGWAITRRGDDFLTISAPEGSFRFRFDFGDATTEGWIYALVALVDAQTRACYVGATTDFPSRMAQHLRIQTRNRRQGQTSTEFFRWARHERALPWVIVLERVMGRSIMCARERAWTDAARNAGWLLPGGERWASRAARPIWSASDHLQRPFPRFDPDDFNQTQSLASAVRLKLLPEELLWNEIKDEINFSMRKS